MLTVVKTLVDTLCSCTSVLLMYLTALHTVMHSVIVTGSCSGDTRLLDFDPNKLFSLQAFLSRCLCVWSPGAHPEVQTAQWETTTASEVSRQPDQLLHQHPAALLPQRRPRWGTQQSESRLLESRTRLDAVPLTSGRFNLLTNCSQTLKWNSESEMSETINKRSNNSSSPSAFFASEMFWNRLSVWDWCDIV